MERRQFVKSIGAGFAGLYANAVHAELHSAVNHSFEGLQDEMWDPATPDMANTNNQIRRERFDTVLLEVMRKYKIDMWMHVMREYIPDPFGAEDLGSTSGVFIFTDRGGDRIERAILERRWGDSFAAPTWPVEWNTRLVETCGAYDIIAPAVLVKEPSGDDQETEYHFRFNGFRKFVEERKPQRIAINFNFDLSPYATSTKVLDGLSCTDYLLLTKELGPENSAKLVSSEYVMMDFGIRKVPSEIALLKDLRKLQDEHIKKTFAAIVPGVSRGRDAGVTLFRREAPGISQRGRSPGYENLVIEGGDIVCFPSQGTYAYVLRKGETEPPPEIKKLYGEYRKVDAILQETIKVGLTPREIVKSYKPKFADAGFDVRDEQLQFSTPPEDFPAFMKGRDWSKTQLCVDCHGMGKGSRLITYENYFGPRIGSNGPKWCWDIPLPPNHHCVLEYFIYMPWRSTEYKDQYLFWWDHEQVLVTPETGVEYLSPMKHELLLIGS